jgi:hypothetical protein
VVEQGVAACERWRAGGAGVDDQRHRRVVVLGDEAEQLAFRSKSPSNSGVQSPPIPEFT